MGVVDVERGDNCLWYFLFLLGFDFGILCGEKLGGRDR